MDARKFGYIRVSSKDQNEGRQLEVIQKLGVDERDIFLDKQSGKRFQSSSVWIIETSYTKRRYSLHSFSLIDLVGIKKRFSRSGMT